MTPILQVMLGMGIGLIGALLLTFSAIEYARPNANQGNQNRRGRKETSDHFYAEPGKRCPICLETMLNPRDMMYLNCGHALHDDCCKKLKNYNNKCPECRADI